MKDYETGGGAVLAPPNGSVAGNFVHGQPARQENYHETLSAQGARRGLLSPAILRSGYVPRNEMLDAVLNRSLAAVYLALTAPVFVTIWLMLRLSSPDPVFYRGRRIGKDGQIFEILKFRTLKLDAARQTAGGTLPTRTLLETKLGASLRRSRLDELPQLINILRGDMVFFGPRPIRPELEHLYASQVPGYEIRFRVRPGLIGMSQALMPHGASKRLRGRFNRMCCRAEINYLAALGFVSAVGWAVVRRSIASAGEALRELRSPLGAYPFLKSGFSRPKSTIVTIDAGDHAMTAGLVGISDEILQFVTTLPPATGPHLLEITRTIGKRREIRIPVQAEIQTVAPLGAGQSGFVSYATYKPSSDYARYRIERYLLGLAVLRA